ncbi:MAG: hypothetical protein WD075_11040 [Rhodospirillales bacterium]
MKWFFIPTLMLLAAVSLPASADKVDHAQCAKAFDVCLADCKTTYADDAAGHAACVPQCSGKYAACDAGVAYDKAKPWIEDQAKKTKKFFDDMLENLKKDPPKEDAPKNKSI